MPDIQPQPRTQGNDSTDWRPPNEDDFMHRVINSPLNLLRPFASFALTRLTQKIIPETGKTRMMEPRRWRCLHPVWVWAASGTAFLLLGGRTAHALRIDAIDPHAVGVVIQFLPDPGDVCSQDLLRCRE